MEYWRLMTLAGNRHTESNQLLPVEIFIARNSEIPTLQYAIAPVLLNFCNSCLCLHPGQSFGFCGREGASASFFPNF